MLHFTLTPRFNDTDALGHINNAIYGTWFEEARRPIFQMFIPDLDIKKWNLIVARVELDFLQQGQYQAEIQIETGIEKIGNSSFVVYQEAFQSGLKIAQSKSFFVHFDYAENKSKPLPETSRQLLSEHFL